VQKLGGLPILDITLKSARMYNPYVVVPTPDNVEQAYVANAPDPQAKVDVQKAGTGVYFVTGASHNSLAVEFKDYVAVIESPVGDNRAVPMFEAVKKQFPNKRIRYVINTHHHFDHAGGLRDAVAEGTTILTYRDNKPYYEKVLANRHTNNPDRMQKSAPARKPSVEAVADKRVLSDGTQTLELYKIQGSNHADTMLIAYFPKTSCSSRRTCGIRPLSERAAPGRRRRGRAIEPLDEHPAAEARRVADSTPSRSNRTVLGLPPRRRPGKRHELTPGPWLRSPCLHVPQGGNAWPGFNCSRCSSSPSSCRDARSWAASSRPAHGLARSR